MSTVPRFHNNYEKIMMNAIDESLSTLGEQSKESYLQISFRIDIVLKKTKSHLMLRSFLTP